MRIENKWTQEELSEAQVLDEEIAKLGSSYFGDPSPEGGSFVPCDENLARINAEVGELFRKVSSLKDPFWKGHFTAALESLSFQIESNTKMPYEHITRASSGLDRLQGRTRAQNAQECALAICTRLKNMVDVVEAVGRLAAQGTDLAKCQVADVLPPLLTNVERGIDFVRQKAPSEGAKADGERYGAAAIVAIKKVQSTVESLPVGRLEPVDIPFKVSVEKGMQAPLDYLLSWYEEDAKFRHEEYLKVGRETFPGEEPQEVLRRGQGYDTVEALFKDIREILDRLQRECTRFVDLPEGEHCDIGFIPETWRMMVPGFMYMGGMVGINPDNLGSYTKVDLETTLVHEVYPGHHVHGIKSRQHALPRTFRLGLFWSRCLQEGMCDRSMVMMTPYFEHPAARLSVASRLRFTAARAKAEVDIYYSKKPVQSIIDNYIQNLGLPSYNAHAQTRAHLMRPADAISYYTGFKYLQDLYAEAGYEQKAFTNEIFSYGSIPLKTMKGILALPKGKKEQIKTFTSGH